MGKWLPTGTRPRYPPVANGVEADSADHSSTREYQDRNPQPTDCSWVAFSGGAVIITYFIDEPPGRHLFVTLASKDADSISDERAADILAHFRGVGPFMERTFTPDVIAERFPHVRTWVALPYETIKNLPIPARPPAILDTPLNPHLRAVRKHLPTKLPDDWSVPLAVTHLDKGGGPRARRLAGEG